MKRSGFDRDITDPTFAIPYIDTCRLCGETEDSSVGLYLNLDGRGICDYCVNNHISGEIWNLNSGESSFDFDRMTFDRDEDSKYKAVKLSGYLCDADFNMIYHETLEIEFKDKYLLRAGICGGTYWEQTVKRLKSAMAFRRHHEVNKPMPITVLVDFFEREGALPWYYKGFIRQVLLDTPKENLISVV